MIELHTFGALNLRGADGRELRPIVAQPKRLALLVYLAVAASRRFVRRDSLLVLFWPDSDQQRARAALSRAVHFLRSFMGEGVLLSRGDDELGLAIDFFSCDAVRFRDALEANRLEDALDSYDGDFLEGFFLSDVPEFERWVDNTREEFRSRAAAAARELSLGAEQKDNLELALHWARRAAGLAPYDESDLRRVLTLLDRSGDRAGAVDAYQRFAQRLAAELELEPSAETRDLLTAITSRVQVATGAELITPTPIAAPAAQQPPRTRRRRVALLVLVGGLVLGGALVLGVRWRNAPGHSAGTTVRSIAVLPFANLSSDSANQYFSDGMTDELIAALSEVNGLRVAARTSSFAFKNRGLSAKDVARELNVGLVLEGSVRREQNRLRITVQLVDAAGDHTLWSNTYDRELRDVFAVQAAISREVVNALKIRLIDGQERPRGRTTDVETYDLYLWGRYYWNARSLESLRTALGYFERAVARDSLYAPAFTGLADSYNLIAVYDQPPTQVMPKAKAAAERALALDETQSEAHAALAYIATWYEWDWAAAEPHFQRALELNPSNATAHHWYSLYLAATGRASEALAEMDFARELDPTSLFLRGATGVRLYFARDYARAADHLEPILALDPRGTPSHAWLGLVYVQLNRVEEAIAHLEKSRQLVNDQPGVLAALAIAYGAAGRRTDALDIMRTLETRAQREYFAHSWLARAYAALGDHERALIWFEKAYEERDGWLTFAGIDPALDPLRGDSRFQRILERMGLE